MQPLSPISLFGYFRGSLLLSKLNSLYYYYYYYDYCCCYDPRICHVVLKTITPCILTVSFWFPPTGQSQWSSLVLVAPRRTSAGEPSPAHHPRHDLPQGPPRRHSQSSHLRHPQAAAVIGPFLPKSSSAINRFHSTDSPRFSVARRSFVCLLSCTSCRTHTSSTCV